MGLFPQNFIDDLKAQTDIVRIVQDSVSLKKSGATYKGLCPFHGEKTPSFHVNSDKGFFHCFGCGAGGDVIKFLELREKITFPDAVRQLAERSGMTLPDKQDNADPAADAEREALLKMQEVAEEYFREHLADSSGARIKRQLEERSLTAETIKAIGFGFAPGIRDGLTNRLREQGFSQPLMLRSGLVIQRESGLLYDRFRNRLMIPICREGGSIMAFGGRAIDPNQQPKYLNSPETPIYSKGRTLYGLHLSKQEIRKRKYAVLVEGYFDFAQVLQAGITPAVATCGTALTSHQSRLLRRYTSKVVLNFDADTAGQAAAARSGEMLIADGFQVNIAVLPDKEDPDTFIREQGAERYMEILRNSRHYLEFMLDRAAADYDFTSDDQRRKFLNQMLNVAKSIPDAATRDQFADRLAHKARVMEEVVRLEIRKAAVARRTIVEEETVPYQPEVRTAEKGLIWAIVHEPETALEALSELDDRDVEGLVTGALLLGARSFHGWPVKDVPAAFMERLSQEEKSVVSTIVEETDAPAHAIDCARTLKRQRYERDRALLQEEIDKLQEHGTAEDLAQIDVLWQRKKDLLSLIETLTP
jgi:DNA primase|tara:strand:- start:4211 stop:5974 length:1764 start_codon:yes stop_codon:yes gene_type:complete